MHDVVVVPTILTNDPNIYQNIASIYNTITSRIQIDISDGNFTANPTLALNQIRWPATWKTDLHLMVSRPSEYLPLVLQLKPSLVIFHAETGEDLRPIFQQLKSAGIKAGVALLKTTFPGNIASYIEAADHVLVFAGALGQQGGTADMMQIEKIPLIKKINSAVEIGWDGGANLENIRAIARSGVDVINVGGALMNAPDKAAAYKELTAETSRRGVRI